MGNLLQETQIKLRRDLVMLRLQYYTSLRRLQADADREQWSWYKYVMQKEELAGLETSRAFRGCWASAGGAGDGQGAAVGAPDPCNATVVLA